MLTLAQLRLETYKGLLCWIGCTILISSDLEMHIILSVPGIEGEMCLFLCGMLEYTRSSGNRRENWQRIQHTPSPCSLADFVQGRSINCRELEEVI